MSYKALKEYFQSCPLQRCSVAAPPLSSICLKSSEGIDGVERKPPKGSLKSKLAYWDLKGNVSNLDCRKLVSSVRNVSELESVSELEKPQRIWQGEKCGRKRSFVEDFCDTKRRDNQNAAEDREIEGRKTESDVPISNRQIRQRPKRTKMGPCMVSTLLATESTNCGIACSSEMANKEDVQDENIDSIQIVPFEDQEDFVRDSDAGLYTKPEPQGPFEPLVLWPPLGEDSSNGVANARVVQVPSSINSRLLEHQRQGIIFLYNRYRNNQGGLLGDDMGLGKTIQTIGFLAAVLVKDPECDESRASTSSSTISIRKRQFEKVVLIICPTSVVQNWEQEFGAWGEFEVGIYHGAQRESVLARIVGKEVEIVLTSHDTFRLHGEELCTVNWDCVIVDEAHRLKNQKSKFYTECLKLPTLRRYGLSGTVMQNRYLELFNVFDWAVPGCLGTREHFSEYYADPIKQGQRISAPGTFVLMAEDRQKHLNVILKRHYLRRTKCETIGHLMKGKEDNVVFCPMSTVQKNVYKRVLQSPDYQALINKSLPCTCNSPLTRAECCYRIVPNGPIWAHLHRDSLEDGCDLCPYCLVLPCLTKLRQLSNHLELIKPNPKDDIDKQNKDLKFAQMAFGDDADLVGGVHPNQSFLGLSDVQHCGKMIATEKLLTSWVALGDKVLLFSDSVRMLDILERLLIRKGYCFSRLDGSIPMNTRQALVEDFNHSPAKQVFLISTRAGGLGLNLTSANRVVIFDPNWNPAHDLQAQDRSFRFGQNRHVTVFRLLAAGSLEELIYTRQIYKQQLFNIALTGVSEKRYFEGVQGSKQHQGELFGMSNLFRDISEDIFAEDIIENHEERLVQIQRIASVEDVPNADLSVNRIGANSAGEDADHQGYLSSVETDDNSAAGDSQEPDKQLDELDSEEQRTQRKVLNALTKAGVKYSHRNEDVVNLGHSTQKPTRRQVKQASNLHSCSNQQKFPIERKNSSNLSQGKGFSKDSSQPIKVSLNTTPIQSQDVLADRKRAMFAKLARFKSMSESEFSKWIVSISQQERSQLQSDYANSLSNFRL